MSEEREEVPAEPAPGGDRPADGEAAPGDLAAADAVLEAPSDAERASAPAAAADAVLQAPSDTERALAPAAAADTVLQAQSDAERASAPPGEARVSAGRRLRAILSLAALLVAAFLCGLLLFNYAVMPRLVHTQRVVKVPDLSNLTLEQAERELLLHGLQLSRAGERYDTSLPRGFVLSQDPPPGTPVRGRRRVSVVVSLGEEFSTVPELSGESTRGARLLLERAGLQVGPVAHAPSEEVGQGLVVASDPGPERVVPRNTPVALLVSEGPPVEAYVMPDLLGREIGGVRRQLEALGFEVVTPPAMPAVGNIVSQEPAAGARIARRATILVTASGRVIR